MEEAAAAAEYPIAAIDPTTYDLIIIGTGLPASIIASAASSARKTVLHVDPNPFYGSHFTSLPLHETLTHLNNRNHNHNHNLFSSPTLLIPNSTLLSPQLSRTFSLDLSGPRALFCNDKTIHLLLKSRASNYLEFKSVDATFVFCEGRLVSVPDSRAAIFKDRTLGLAEKNQLMRFFKLVQGHLEGGEEEERRVKDEDLECSFFEFLSRMRLPHRIKSMILYAIAMADYDQENVGLCKDLLTTKQGIDRLALYHSSIGRFSNALGALIYPIYGQGELPQAFCRKAAVKGCLYVLRMPVVELLLDKETNCYRGVKLASGQEIYSKQLVLDPSFAVTESMVSSPTDNLGESLKKIIARDIKGKVARAICITKSSLKPDLTNLLVVYPPKSLNPEQVTSIRVLQISDNVAVCPAGMFVLYISALCDDVDEGKKLLRAAIDSLLTVPDGGNTDGNTTIESEGTEVKPIVIWSALYVEELIEGHYGPISITPTPDGNLHYNDTLDATVKLFQQMYPNEELFPDTSHENSEDEAAVTMDDE